MKGPPPCRGEIEEAFHPSSLPPAAPICIYSAGGSRRRWTLKEEAFTHGPPEMEPRQQQILTLPVLYKIM